MRQALNEGRNRRSFGPEWFESANTIPHPLDRSVFEDDTLTNKAPIQEGRALTFRSRRSHSIGLSSFKNGVSEIRSLGRRLSNSVRKGGRNKLEMVKGSHAESNGSAEPSFQPEDSGQWARSRVWFRSPSARRRPSLPSLSHALHDFSPPSYKSYAIPGSRHGPPILPDDLNSGAGARAAAAAQNEALQTINGRFSTSLAMDTATSQISEIRIHRDSESGIGIDIRDLHDPVCSSIEVIRHDPTDVLATELVEHIFCFLDSTSLLQAENVSRQWRSVATSNIVWRHIFRREYDVGNEHRSSSAFGPGPARGLGKNIPSQDWKKMFSVRQLIDQRWTRGEAAAIYLNGHKDSVYCVQFDEHKIITGSRDKTIRVWDTHTYLCVKKIGPPHVIRDRTTPRLRPVNPVGVHPIYRVDKVSAGPLKGHVPEEYHDASVLCLQYDNEIMVTGSSDKTCIVWSIKEDYRPMRRLRGHTGGVLDVCIDSQCIITCSKDTSIVVWDRHTGELVRRLSGHRGPVNAVSIRGHLLASASGDGMARLWNLEAGICIKEFSSEQRGLACVEFSENGRRIFAGGNDKVIYEYDTITGRTVRKVVGHEDLVRSLHLDTANNRIVSGSYDSSVKVWDARKGCSSTDGGLKINFSKWTTSWMLSAKSDYRKIVCTSQDGRVVIIDFGHGIDSADLLQA